MAMLPTQPESKPRVRDTTLLALKMNRHLGWRGTANLGLEGDRDRGLEWTATRG
jgi:hypothetical protein